YPVRAIRAPAAALDRCAASITWAHRIAWSRLLFAPPVAAARKSAATPPNQSGWCDPADSDGGQDQYCSRDFDLKLTASPTTRISPSSPSISIMFDRSSAAQVRKMLLTPAAVSRSTLAVSSNGCS